MKNILKKILNITPFFLLLHFIINPQELSLDTYIANSYLHATFGPIQPIKKELTTHKKKNPFNLPQLEEKLLTEREKQEIAFNITNTRKRSVLADVAIDKTFIEKMELITGGAKSEEHLISKIFNNTHTALGKSWAIQQLLKPTTNISHLQRRQEAIQLLSDNPKLLNQLDILLRKLSKAEHQLLSFWHQESSYQQSLKFIYFNIKQLKKFNTNTIMLELSNKFINLLDIFNGTIGIPINNIIGIKLAKYLNGSSCSFQEAAINLGDAYKNWFKSLKNNTTPLDRRIVIALLFSANAFAQGYSVYSTAIFLKNKMNLGKYLQGSLIDIASYVHYTRIIKHIANQNNELLNAIPSLKHVINFDNRKHHSAQLIKLLDMLNTNTFKRKPSAFSLTGRIFAAHKLMTLVKNEFIPMLNAIAELDTYVALAKLHKNQLDTAPYTFVEFQESETPRLKAINFWNPFIDPQIVVTNTIHFNRQSGQNVILTGPNTGGKSTVIKALLINILFAQTFGMAAAEKFIITPFNKLNCYLNITDDIAAGTSLFKAEVTRAKELITTLRTLPSQEFCFTIIDEAFSGTSPQEGEFASYKFADQLADFPNGITLIATHYHKLIDLEQEKLGSFKNYHVEVIRNEDGSLQRTFKLLPEPSRMNIALDILKEEGVL